MKGHVPRFLTTIDEEQLDKTISLNSIYGLDAMVANSYRINANSATLSIIRRSVSMELNEFRTIK